MVPWAVVFKRLGLDTNRLANHAHNLAMTLSDNASHLWDELAAWIAPGSAGPRPTPEAAVALESVAEAATTLARQIDGDRLLALRTRGIGVLTRERLEAAGPSGPALWASERGAGDVQSRLQTRLEAVLPDLRAVAEAMSAGDLGADGPAFWKMPGGVARVAVDGPRGRIGLRLASDGGKAPARVEWERPTAALLPLLPELLAGQKLADAVAIVACLDLAMAEADG